MMPKTANVSQEAKTVMCTLHPEHLDDLNKSGLSGSTIGGARLYSVDGQDLVQVCGRQVPSETSGLVFPYDDTFNRVKLFPPLRDPDGGSIKYLQPAGSAVRAYIPPMSKEALADVACSLYVTEGEKKALKLSQEGFPSIGLGGIWNFKAKAQPPDALIADFEAIPWKERSVYLVPDADAWTNECVLLAVYRLGRLLEARSAIIRVVRLPELPGQKKTGADDYLVKEGQTSFRRLQEKSIPLTSQAFKTIREREKVKAEAEKTHSPVPEELAGRWVHPAIHFDADGFAAVGIIERDKSWRILTSERREYSAEAIGDALSIAPIKYAGLEERWGGEHRTAFLNGDTPLPSWAKMVATTLALFRDYLEFDEESPYAVLALWSLGTYFHHVLPSFPRLNLHGEKHSGKSKTLRLVANLAFNGLLRTAPRAAGLFRLIEALRATLCLDEIENLDRASRGDIDAILNSGYQAGGAVDRCEGDSFSVRPYAVYAPVALAGIRGLNAVLADRCVTLTLQPGRDRARMNRDVDPNRLDPRIPQVRDLAYRLYLTRCQEMRAVQDSLALPPWLYGRSRELWSPLLALANLVVEEAPELDLRPSLLSLARPDAEGRAELEVFSEAVLTALEKRLNGKQQLTIQPGELVPFVEEALGEEVSSILVGFRLKSLGFERDPSRHGGSFYTVTAEAIHEVRDRNMLLSESDAPQGLTT